VIKLRRQSILKGAFVSSASKGLARFMRFLLLLVITHKFGTSYEVDAYLLIQSITLLFLTLNDTVFNFTLIPMLAKERETNGEEEAKRLASSAFAFLNIFFFVVSLVIFVSADAMAGFLASFSEKGIKPGTVELAALLIKVIAPIPFLAGLGGVPASIFFSHRSFVLPSVTFLFYSISSIIAGVFLTDALGIVCIPGGATFGVALQAVVLMFALWKVGGLSFSFRIHRSLGDLIKLTAPRLLGRSLATVNLFVDKILVLGRFEGSVTCLMAAFRVNQFPISFLVAPLGTTMPVISDQIARGEFDKVHELIKRILGLITFLVLPVAVGLCIIREPFIGLVFEHGNWTAEDTARTASVYFYYNLAILPMAVNMMMLGTLFALREARWPMFINLLGFGLNWGLDLLFIRFMGIDGIAVAKIVLALINSAILFTVIQKKIGALQWGAIFRESILKIGAASTLSGLAVWLVNRFGPSLWGDNRYILVPIAIGTGLCVYVLSCVIFRVREVREARQLISRKFSRRNRRNNSVNESRDNPGGTAGGPPG
jgi:putative peptidoglycan lipid II flippase